MPRYEVAIIYMGQENYIIEALTPGEAEEKAAALYNRGEPGVKLGNECEKINIVRPAIEIDA